MWGLVGQEDSVFYCEWDGAKGSPWLRVEAGPCEGGEQGGGEEAAGESGPLTPGLGEAGAGWGWGTGTSSRSWNDFLRATKSTSRRGEVSVGQREGCRVTSEMGRPGVGHKFAPGGVERRRQAQATDRNPGRQCVASVWWRQGRRGEMGQRKRPLKSPGVGVTATAAACGASACCRLPAAKGEGTERSGGDSGRKGRARPCWVRYGTITP